MKSDVRAEPAALSGRRRFLYWCVILSVPLLAIGTLELGARWLARTSDAGHPSLRLVGTTSFFEEFDYDGRTYCRVAHDELYGGAQPAFTKHKEDGTVRIFCFGGSAAAGWPHPPEETFTAYLQSALENALPGRQIEVLNFGAHAYASYRVQLIADQALAFDPDLVVLYMGNNEFLEKRTYAAGSKGLKPLRRAAGHLVSFRLASNWWIERTRSTQTLSAERREHGYHERWTKIRRLALDLRAQPDQYDAVIEHFEETATAIVETAEASGVPVYVLTVPVNLRDWHPNVSQSPEETLAAPDLETWRRHYSAARQSAHSGRTTEAVQHFEQAIALHPNHAESFFCLGRTQEMLGDWDGARHSFSLANDLDFNPFRATWRVNDVLRRVGRRHDNVTLVDIEAAFFQEVSPRVPGFDLFLDYVHPSRVGNLVIAENVFQTLAAEERFGLSKTDPFQPRIQEAYDELRDARLQRTLFWLFAMMHQYDSIVERARHLETLTGTDVPYFRKVIEVFEPQRELELRRAQGLTVDPEKAREIEARLHAYYIEEFDLEPDAFHPTASTTR